MVDGTPYESICKADLVMKWVTMNLPGMGVCR